MATRENKYMGCQLQPGDEMRVQIAKNQEQKRQHFGRDTRKGKKYGHI